LPRRWTPLSGSFYVESLTTAIEEQARAYMTRIDAMGGMVAAIERGWVQREIEDAVFRHQQAFDSGASVVVGVNRFIGPDSMESPQKSEGTVEQDQIERMRRDPLCCSRPGHGAGSLQHEPDAGYSRGGRKLCHRG
jgi:methylmalonyl-CoA mutase N-terminal domain/subunit